MKGRSGPEGEEQRLEAAAAAVSVPVSRVRYFVQVGLVRPSRVEGRVPFFGEAEMGQLRRIRRLRDDLGLNMAGIEVALRLLDEIESLRRELGQGSGGAGIRVSQSRRSPSSGSPSDRSSSLTPPDRGGSNGER
jgi:MerR family transcriptional regulator, heat shock protein HspR